MKLLSRIDELILVAIWKLGPHAYGMAIREEIIKATGVHWLLGAIYGPLGRLHRQKLVTTMRGDPTPERGGRAKVYYDLTPSGLKELKRIQAVNAAIWKGAQKINV
jgi:DNA-binding PadR family transcriptional regulator